MIEKTFKNCVTYINHAIWQLYNTHVNLNIHIIQQKYLSIFFFLENYGI